MRHADVDRCAIHHLEPRGDLNVADGIGRPERPYCHHHATAKRSRGDRFETGPVTVRPSAQLDVPEPLARLQDRLLERIGAAEHDGDGVAAPERQQIGYVLDELTVSEN